jgi:predicted Rossmann fold nucleotide-binding protein DprA/Smf involved in DNA uptake
MTSKQSIAITGSRDVDRETARVLFEQHLSPLLQQGRTWMLGGARGVDHWAIEWLTEHSEVCWAVVPYTRAKLPKWIHPWLDEVDRVVELQLPKRKSAYAFRNRYMVDLSGIVFGFWSSQGGATVKTLKYALRKRREVHAIPVFTRSDDEVEDHRSSRTTSARTADELEISSEF